MSEVRKSAESKGSSAAEKIKDVSSRGERRAEQRKVHNERAKNATEKFKGKEKQARREVQQAVKTKESQKVQKHEKISNKTEKQNKRRPAMVSAKDKKATYQATVKTVQSKMPAPVKAFSKVIHNPVVDKVSETAGKTVARPSGIIGGGLAIILGLGLSYFTAQVSGFELSGSEFIWLLLGGFIIGVVAEFGVKTFRNSAKLK